MKSGQRILGDRTQDPRLSCPNADHCTTASPYYIDVVYLTIPQIHTLLYDNDRGDFIEQEADIDNEES